MSAVLPSTTNPPIVSVPPGAPSTLQKIEGVAVDTLKLAVNFAATPAGMAAITAILGPASPVVNLIVQFGVRALSGILPTIAPGTVLTDADVQALLSKGGVRVEPYDPTTMFLPAAGG
jgi:hypothetical protein